VFMGLRIKILSLVVGVIFFLFVLKFIKENSFRPSYAILWILVSFFLVSIPVFESFYVWVTYSVIGLNDARNIIYIVLIGFLLVYAFYATLKISQMSDQIQELISFTAILEAKIGKRGEDV